MSQQSTLGDFYKNYRTNDDCREFLFNLKWKKGFCCFKCGHTSCGKGRTRFNLRCKQCGYDESVLANTVFHKLKIPLFKAFGMLYLITNAKGGSSSIDLAHLFGTNQKSAWYFKRKVQQALLSVKSPKKKRTLKRKSYLVDSILVSGRDPGSNGLQQVQLDVEEFTSEDQDPKQVCATSSFPLGEKKHSSELLKGKFDQPNPNIQMWNFKAWITGTHHHSSAKYLQGYVDEYLFRYSNRLHLNKIWYKLMALLVQRKPH
ncbi:MAG: transposase [Sphingobacteriales bacterium]|nr:MAG: transposase [Sphingobacteriales bacterium]